ncbi:MAG: ornithine cyclodeaminase family protein [Hyphomicrobiaceae bacterium]
MPMRAPIVLSLAEIKRALEGYDPLPAMELALSACAAGRAVTPPVGELLFDEPRGDAQIKFGMIRNAESFIVKVAAGFYDNPRRGLPANSGVILVLSQKTGRPRAILIDEGWLTALRTAAAGAVAARYLAPRAIEAIGVIGTGDQARMQLDVLRRVTPVRNVVAFGRNRDTAGQFAGAMAGLGYEVALADSAAEVAARAQLIVTATPATSPVLKAADIRPGTHITAVGADTSDKQELDPAILARAAIVATDSVAQALSSGEIHHALIAGQITARKPVELGHVIMGSAARRTSDDQITVADLTGVVVEDLMMAEAVLEAIGG